MNVRLLKFNLKLTAVLAVLLLGGMSTQASAHDRWYEGHRHRIAGTCGSSAGQTLSSAPSDDLCATGTATDVTTTRRHYKWFCAGIHGGRTARCTATISASSATEPDNGICGSSNGQTLSAAPTTNLCGGTSTASAINGSGPWTWTCAGTNGGTTVQCSASVQSASTASACGTHSSGSTYTLTTSSTTSTVAASAAQCVNGGTVPTLTVVTQKYICTNGTQTASGSAVTTTTNGTPVCTAVTAASCGSHASGSSWSVVSTPVIGKTAATAEQCPNGGTVPTSTTTKQNYTCTNGTQTASGSAVTTTTNGTPVCTAVTAASCGSHASGSSWSVVSTPVIGTAAATTAQCPNGGTVPTSTTTTQQYTCNNGTQTASGSPILATTITGSPTCAAAASCGSYLSGSTYTLTTNSTTGTAAASAAQCPNGGTVPTLTATTQQYTCNNGTQTALGSANTTTTNAGPAVCNSTAVSGVCGSSNGQTLSSAPTTNLCSTGTASTVTNTTAGSWSWTCSSTGGAATSCAAQQSTSSGITSGLTLLGAFLGDPGNPNGSFPSESASFINAMGMKPKTIDTYVDDTQPESTWPNSAQYSAWGISTISWGFTVIPTLGFPMAAVGEDSISAFNNFASGAYDADVNGVFQAYVDKGFTVLFVRFGWEYNGNWYPWSVTTNNESQWIAAWQHLATLAHNFQGMKIYTVWNPGGDVGYGPSYKDTYPGDAYVDVMSIDTYGVDAGGVDDSSVFDDGVADGEWTVLSGMAFASQHNKPFSYSEVGTGTNDATFPNNLASAVASSPYKPEIAFMNIWDDASGGNNNLFWSDNPTTSAAWVNAFNAVSAASGH